MKKRAVFFRPYMKYGLEGYHIPVRNSFNNLLEDEFIPKEAKDLYKKKFGETIIKDEVFTDWYAENASQFD